MNPQRLVAAVAALAIGFGVTLVGVGFDGDGDDAVVTAEPDLADDGPLTDPDDGEADVDEPAEQEEEAAEEPQPAEVEAPEPTAPTPQTQDAPSAQPDTAPPTSTSDEMEIEETDDIDDFDGPQSGTECVEVVSVPVGNGVTNFVFVSFLSETTVRLLGPTGFVLARLPQNAQIDITPREVTFADGLPVDFGVFCDLDSFDDGGGPIGGPLDGSVVPCDGLDLYQGAIDLDAALAPRYGDVLLFEDASDLVGYRFIVAAAAERAAEGSFDDFYGRVEAITGEFRTECPFDVDSLLDFDQFIELFIEDEFSDAGYDELLCNLGQLSADSRLIDFLADQARAFDPNSCQYEEEA